MYNDSALPWELALHCQRGANAKHDKIATDVEDRVGNEVIRSGIALWVRSWDCPVIVEWPAPYGKVENLHEHKSKSNIASEKLDKKILEQLKGKTIVHNDKGCFERPYRENLHLLHHENKLSDMLARPIGT